MYGHADGIGSALPGSVGAGSKFQTRNVPAAVVGMKFSRKLPSGMSISFSSVVVLLVTALRVAEVGEPSPELLLRPLALSAAAPAASGSSLVGSNGTGGNRRTGGYDLRVLTGPQASR